MSSFQYDTKIIQDYPNLTAGVIVASGMSNAPTAPELLEAYLGEQEGVKNRIGSTPLSELASLAAWRRAISAFGVSPTKYRSAAEALLRRLTKKGDIPSINTLVDIGNLVSIRYGLPVAIFDRREIQGAITVHYAAGSEAYMELGSDEIMHPEVGEVIFSDEKQMVVARRWCWRQSATSAANADTSNAVVTVEAHHEDSKADIENALSDLLELLRAHAGGDFNAAVLNAESPAI
ncbi:MAG: phenylalanine--tRNA ligase beta subunit-related protein [Chloroflexi bacterium]|nr:phenylalanine--tRNA ligase beta subunit-related protein [Chloroflexota bacterium]